MMTNKDQSRQEHLVTAEMLKDLPQPVQRYLDYTGVVGKPWVDTVHLKQTGRFRQGLERPWMPMTVEQSYTTKPPAFEWNARFKMLGLPLLRARDKYESGQGHMFGKVAGLYTIFDVHGEKLDQGTMVRYLSEMIWFPSAFLGENISWNSVDEHSAQVTFTDYGKSVSAQMHFDETGKLTNFTAQRYREIEGEFSLDPWSTPITSYGVLSGLNLPVGGQAVWNLPSGDLVYAEVKLTEIRYNTSA
jgi:hypothetical protein